LEASGTRPQHTPPKKNKPDGADKPKQRFASQTAKPPTGCKNCGRNDFASDMQFQNHVKVAHYRITAASCQHSDCNGKYFGVGAGLTQHVQSAHPEDARLGKKKKARPELTAQLLCLSCGKDDFADAVGLTDHSNLAHPWGMLPKKLKCPHSTCKDRPEFSDKSSFLNHIGKAHDTPRYVCKEGKLCRGAFSTEEKREEHELAAHRGTKIQVNYCRANDCTEVFKSFDELLKHVERRHRGFEARGLKPFFCYATDCGEGFDLSRQLEEHIRGDHLKKSSRLSDNETADQSLSRSNHQPFRANLDPPNGYLQGVSSSQPDQHRQTQSIQSQSGHRQAQGGRLPGASVLVCSYCGKDDFGDLVDNDVVQLSRPSIRAILLRDHTSIVHSNKGTIQAHVKAPRCPHSTCVGHAGFSSADEMFKHFWVSHGHASYSCPSTYCRASFETRAERDQHSIDTHGEKKGKHILYCRVDTCGAIFGTNSSNTQKQQNEHNRRKHDGSLRGQFPHFCEALSCGQGFMTSILLQTHVQENHMNRPLVPPGASQSAAAGTQPFLHPSTPAPDSPGVSVSPLVINGGPSSLLAPREQLSYVSPLIPSYGQTPPQADGQTRSPSGSLYPDPSVGGIGGYCWPSGAREPASLASEQEPMQYNAAALSSAASSQQPRPRDSSESSGTRRQPPSKKSRQDSAKKPKKRSAKK
jgi:hypothetical protein